MRRDLWRAQVPSPAQGGTLTYGMCLSTRGALKEEGSALLPHPTTVLGPLPSQHPSPRPPGKLFQETQPPESIPAGLAATTQEPGPASGHRGRAMGSHQHHQPPPLSVTLEQVGCRLWNAKGIYGGQHISAGTCAAWAEGGHADVLRTRLVCRGRARARPHSFAHGQCGSSRAPGDHGAPWQA